MNGWDVAWTIAGVWLGAAMVASVGFGIYRRFFTGSAGGDQ